MNVLMSIPIAIALVFMVTPTPVPGAETAEHDSPVQFLHLPR